MNLSALVPILVGGAVVWLIARRFLRNKRYRPSSIENIGEVLAFIPARDAFRNQKNLAETKEYVDKIIAGGTQRVIVDLSLVEPGFFDDGVFGVLVTLYDKICRKASGRLVLVKPSERVYNSFEFEPFRHEIFPMVENVSDGIRYLDEREAD